MVLPSFIIIYLISIFLDSFIKITWIANAFKGISAKATIKVKGTAKQVKAVKKLIKKSASSVTVKKA